MAYTEREGHMSTDIAELPAFEGNTNQENGQIHTREASIWNEDDRKITTSLLMDGDVVGLYNDGVGALIVDAEQCRTTDTDGAVQDKIDAIKGGRLASPLSSMISSREFVKLIDVSKLHPSLIPLVQQWQRHPAEFDSTLGHMGFVRVPLIPDGTVYDRAVPGCLISENPLDGTKYIQNYSSAGNPPLHQLTRALDKNRMIIGITSMNDHGQPELVRRDDMKEWTKRKGVYFLDDPSIPLMEDGLPIRRGSYPVLVFDSEGVTLFRSGNLPESAFYWLNDNNIPFHQNPNSGRKIPLPQDLALRFNAALPKGLNGSAPEASRATIILATRTGQPSAVIQNRVGRSFGAHAEKTLK